MAVDLIEQRVPAEAVGLALEDLHGILHACRDDGMSECGAVFANHWNTAPAPLSKVSCVQCRQVLEMGYARPAH